MDIPRLREGGFNAQFFSVWMGRTEGDGKAIKTALERIDVVCEAVRKNAADLELAGTAADVRRIAKAGRIACLFGIEGGHIIESSLPALRQLYRLGCRYMTLTHGLQHAPGRITREPDTAVAGEFGGLSPFGEEIVREMNHLGMMVDISHVADSTFWDVIRVSRAPVIASHSSARAVFDHRRNLSDPMIIALAEKGGVVMINFFSGYIDPEWDGMKQGWEEENKEALAALAGKYKANRRAYWGARREFLSTHPMRQTPLVVLARHVEHVAQLVGWEHVGIGADWDGVPALPAQMDHCGMLANLTALLLARGATPEQLRGFLGENLLRVMEACERVAREGTGD